MELTLSFDDSVATNIQFATTLSAAPFNLTATPVVGGGTFAAGTYFYEVTATTALGETTVSNEASAVVGLNGSVNLAWSLPNNVITGIKVYRGTGSGTENTLVTTLGATATTFTDTNVGAGGAPPGTNTATIQDYTLLTGAGWYCGYALYETTGTTAAAVEIQDVPGRIGVCRLSAGGSESEADYGTALPLWSFIKVHVISGSVKGVIYARIPPVC
jgi:hypothetical protein